MASGVGVGGAYLRLPQLQGNLVHLLSQMLCGVLHVTLWFAGLRGAAAGLRAALILSARAAWRDGCQAASFPSVLHININFNACRPRRTQNHWSSEGTAVRAASAACVGTAGLQSPFVQSQVGEGSGQWHLACGHKRCQSTRGLRVTPPVWTRLGHQPGSQKANDGHL